MEIFLRAGGLRKVCVFFLIGLPLMAYATEADSLRHWGAEADIMPGRIITMDGFQGKWQKKKSNLAVDLKLTRATLPQDSNAFDRDYGFPTLSLGLKWSMNHGVTMHKGEEFWGAEHTMKEVDYDSQMGHIATLYGQFARPLLRRRRWEIDYTLNFGIGWSHRKYNTLHNIDNELIGSRWLIFFGAGVHATYHFAREWGIRAGIDYYHHSNGSLNRPNKGANLVGPSIGLVYQPYYEPSLARPVSPVQPASRYWYINLSAGIGARTIMEEWQQTQFYTSPDEQEYRTGNFRTYAAYSIAADAMYRYARRWASGIGIDVFYGTYDKRVKEINQFRGSHEAVSPWSVGLAAKHEVFYRRLSLNTSLGFYLYRKMGHWAKELEKPYYERIGVNYSFPTLGNLEIGINVKAHLTKADLTEVVISYPTTFFRLKNRKNHQ